jgi:HK97 family phage prohead protease
MFKPPREGLIRAKQDGFALRAADEDNGMPTLTGYAIRFGEWTRISSLFEGDFMERIAPGAAKKTLADNADNIRVLFNHGHDPSIGEKALTKPELSEDATGLRYEGQLFDTSYNRDLLPGLESGQYGASFKFRVIREQIVEAPERSAYNPDGIPERTVEDLQLYELGPVTFPAYEGASAGVRSLTGFFALERLKGSEEFERACSEWVKANPDTVRSILVPNDLEESDDSAEQDDSPETVQKHSPSEPSVPHSDAGSRAIGVPLDGTQHTRALEQAL